MSTLDRLVGLAEAMRTHGLEVGSTETTTAAQAIEVLGLDDRRTLREALAATMVRSSDGRATFDQLFDLWFPAAPGARTGDLRGADLDQLRAELTRALAEGDEQRMDEIAAATLELLGQVSPGDETRGWSSVQAVDALAPQRLIADAQAMGRGEGDGDGEGKGSGSGSGGFTERIDRDEIRARVDGDDAGHILRRCRVERNELRMRVRRAQHDQPLPVRRHLIVDIAALAGDEALILESRHRLPRAETEIGRQNVHQETPGDFEFCRDPPRLSIDWATRP